MAEIKNYSVTADDNNATSPAGMPENMAPSGVNNSWRESFARVKRWYEDINGTKSTTGSSNAYVLAAARTVTAYAQGDAYLFRANFTNTAAVTLNVDSVGAVAIVNNTQSALAAGQIQSGGMYLVAYDASNSKFQLVGASATSASGDNIFVFNASPSVTLENSTAEDSNGGRESSLLFKGLQSGSEESTLVKIIGSHDGTSDDQKGKLQIYTNDGSDGDSPTLQLTIDSAGLCTLVGAASVGGALTVAGATQLNSTVTVGANDQGYDVILYGDTASANVTWDTSVDDLILNGAAGLIVPDGQFTLGSTAVTSTGAELNILDGVTSTAAELNLVDGSSAGSVVNSKAVIYSSAGVVNATDVAVSGSGNRSVSITSSNAIGSIEIGSASGNAAFIDLKTPTSDDFDVRLASEAAGAGGSLAIAGGTFSLLGSAESMAAFTHNGAVTLYHDNAAKIATAATGITITGEATATGFTGTLDGILGSGTAAAATVTTLDTSGVVNLNLTTDSSSSTSGALIIDGGVGIAKKLFVGTDADIDGTLEADAITLNGTALGSLYSPIAGSSSIVTTGALNSGSITSGFGAINNGSSTISTSGTVASGALNSTKSSVVKAEIANSTNGHYFSAQSDDNTDGFEIYQQHGSNTTRNSFVVTDNHTGSKVESFLVRGDGRVGIGTSAPDSLVEISSGAATTAKIATTVSNNYAELIFEDGNAGYGFQVRSDGAAGLATGSMVINDRDSSTFPVVINEGNATNTLKLSGGNVSMAGTLTASTGATIFNHLDGTVHSNGGSRAIGTNYTNSAAFDKIIYVSVSNTNANAIMIVTLDGDTIFLGAGATGDANYHIGATIIWPAGKVVNITMNGTPTLSRWVEYA